MHSLFDRPFAFFGHSLGSYVAYELAQVLKESGNAGPRHLFVSGSWGPRVHAARCHVLGEADPLAAVDVPDGLRSDENFMRALSDTLTADAQLFKNYRHRLRAPLSTPITALRGDRDTWLDEESVSEWRRETSVGFQSHAFSGAHMFVQPNLPRIIELVTAAIDARTVRS